MVDDSGGKERKLTGIILEIKKILKDGTKKQVIHDYDCIKNNVLELVCRIGPYTRVYRTARSL